MNTSITSRQVRANGVDLQVLEAGSGQLALCLHGFPDTSHTWRYLLPALADAGFHAVAPTLRGYAPRSLPKDDCFTVGALIADANALHELLGGDERAVIIGHDWGSLAAFGAAAAAPEKWSRLVTMAVPPPALDEAMWRDFKQLQRSFYMFMFLMPGIEDIVAADDLAFLGGLWDLWSPGYDASLDMEHVREALSKRENLVSALALYQSTLGARTVGLDKYVTESEALAGTPPQPTLYLHGQNDGCISSQWVEAALEHLSPGSHALRIADAGHFLHLEKPAEVTQLIRQWVTT